MQKIINRIKKREKKKNFKKNFENFKHFQEETDFHHLGKNES